MQTFYIFVYILCAVRLIIWSYFYILHNIKLLLVQLKIIRKTAEISIVGINILQGHNIITLQYCVISYVESWWAGNI